MERLPCDMFSKFADGNHVMSHKPGKWNDMWLDMRIETTFTRYGDGHGGLIGVNLKPNTNTR